MRKLIIAAATAAALGTLGLAATAQAQPAAARVAATVTAPNVVVGIPASIIVTNPGGTSVKCTTTHSGFPNTVTVGTSSAAAKGCKAEVAGVYTTPGTHSGTIKFKAGGTTTTVTVTVHALAEPCENDAVGVGSDTITPLTDQLSTDYNNTLAARTACGSGTYYESWDATNPVNGQIGDSIPEKADCPSIGRPNGSSAGITQLQTFNKSSSGPFCTNFARSSRGRGATDDPYAAGGVAFTTLATDAVTWSVPTVNTAAPPTLTPAQLVSIFTCQVTNWNQVGGGNQAIVPFLPQGGSGTLSFWLSALGNITAGPCVSNVNNTLEENEGDNSALNNPGAIFIYSVGDWIAQTFHAPKCKVAGCTASNGVICVKVPNLDQFWCNVTGQGTTQGTEKLGQINGTSPTTGSGTGTKINPAFDSTFDRTLYDVVPFDQATTDHIPGATSPVGGVNLEKIFASNGFDCKNSNNSLSSTAKTDIKNYGFVPTANCGHTN